MKAPVKSFESGSRKAGDLLSVKSAAGKLKVGLLTCGYFEYWRMYPKTLKQKVEQDLRKVAASFRRDFDVVCPGLVDTLDAADRAGRLFKKEHVDMLIVVEGTYIPDYLSLHAIDYVRETPLLLFSTQSGDNLDPRSDYEETLRNSGLIGIAQLTGTLAKMGRKYRAVVGSIDDPQAYAEIAAYGAALRVVEKLRRTDIGLIGHTFRGMYDLEQDKTKIKGGLGPNIIYIQTSHLLDLVEKVKDAETGVLAADLKKRFRMRSITDDDLMRSCRVALARLRRAVLVRPASAVATRASTASTPIHGSPRRSTASPRRPGTTCSAGAASTLATTTSSSASWPAPRSITTACQAASRAMPGRLAWRQARAASPITPPGRIWLRKLAR